MSESLSDEYPVWRIVTELRIPLSDIEAEWTFDRIMKGNACLDMKSDYRMAWEEFHRTRRGNDG